MLKRNKNIYIYFILFFSAFSLFICTNKVLASMINLSSDSSSYDADDPIIVRVNVATDKSVNAVSGKVYFPSNVLSLVSLSKNSSIINLWSHEPTFSNKDGLVSFEGVILNGYTGNTGNIITLTFKAKSIGLVNLKMGDVSILANDGNGTESFSGNLNTIALNINKTAISVQKIEPKVIPKIDVLPEIKVEKIVPEKITETATKVVEKIKEVEVENKLIDNSLLITVIIVFAIILVLIIIYFIYFILKIRRYFKNKVSKIEGIVFKNFKNLEKDINLKAIDKKKMKGMRSGKDKDEDILDEVLETEEKIVKEINKIEKDMPQ